MDNQNFENQIFDTLPELIIASNFNNCIFNIGSKFERCNLNHCTVKTSCYFDRSNVMICTGDGLDISTYDRSNREDTNPFEEI